MTVDTPLAAAIFELLILSGLIFPFVYVACKKPYLTLAFLLATLASYSAMASVTTTPFALGFEQFLEYFNITILGNYTIMPGTLAASPHGKSIMCLYPNFIDHDYSRNQTISQANTDVLDLIAEFFDTAKHCDQLSTQLRATYENNTQKAEQARKVCLGGGHDYDVNVLDCSMEDIAIKADALRFSNSNEVKELETCTEEVERRIIALVGNPPANLKHGDVAVAERLQATMAE